MIAITTYLDVVINYDPKKLIFFAEINGKRFCHKKQSRVEALIKKEKEPKKPRG